MAVPLLHQTDLFRPHNDPDDHWDLACVYALAVDGAFDLHGLLIDDPPADQPGAPDATGIAQLNHLTGLRVPSAVGSSIPMASRRDRQEGNGARMVLQTLERAAAPVVITVAGSCRDVAVAGNQRPALFAEKCAGLYLNAGTGRRDVDATAELEYNVRLDPAAYAALFDLPCPVYWMPCFEVLSRPWRVSAFGTWYSFLQADILPDLAEGVQKYFACMFSRRRHTDWLGYLRADKDRALLARQARQVRNMWCTAGFFHAAGRSITPEGRIVPTDAAGHERLFAFDPIDVHCDDNGITRWAPAERATNRFIFHVQDVDRYAGAMTRAMRSLLMTLP